MNKDKIAAARAAGYSDAEIVDFLAQTGRPQVLQARQDGYGDGEILSYLESVPQKQGAPARSLGELASDTGRDFKAGIERIPGILGGLMEVFPDPSKLNPIGAVADAIGLGQDDEITQGIQDQGEVYRTDSAQRVSEIQGRQSDYRQWSRENNPWYSPDMLLSAGVETIPSMAIPIGGALGGRVLGLAPGAAALVGAGLEGVQSAGFTASGIVQELVDRGYDIDEARRVAALPSLAAGAGTALTGGLMSRFESDLLSGLASQGVVKGMARGAASEGVEEAVQSGQEQFFQNVGVRGLDKDQSLTEGVATAAMQGGVLGGIMGGGIGGVAGAGSPGADATGRARQQLEEDLNLAALEQVENEQRGQAIRARREAPTPPAAPGEVLSLADQTSPSFTTPGIPPQVQAQVDQVSWRERVAPVLDQMAQGNYEALLQDQQDRAALREKQRRQKKRMAPPLPDPVAPKPESQITSDPFTAEHAAELIRSAESGPVSESQLRDKNIPRPKETLEILTKRGFLRQVGETRTEIPPAKEGGKVRYKAEPVYESTALKSPEVAGPGQEVELAIKPVASQVPATGGAKAPSPQAVAARERAAREREQSLRTQLAALPQVTEDMPQARIDSLETRRQTLQDQLAQAEFETARATTGRADYAVIERIKDPSGAVREQVVQTFPNRKGAETYLAAKQGQEVVTPEQVQARAQEAEYQKANARVDKALAQRFRELGLEGKAALNIAEEVGVNLDGMIRDPDGYVDTGPSGVVMSLARNIYDPNLSEKDLIDRVSSTMDHEAVHALRSMNVFTPDEWRVLTNEARARKRDGRDYTYLQWANENYKDLDGYLTPEGKVDMDAITEEAVAEMFKDWRKGGSKPGARYAGLMNKLARFLGQLMGRMNAAGVMQKVASGEAGTRLAEQADAKGPQGVTPKRRFMFAGSKSEKAPVDNYYDFEDLMNEGASPAKAYYLTGWYIGMDGEPRYEISDKNAKLVRGYKDKLYESIINDVAVGQILDHPELYEAYPDIMWIPIFADPDLPAGDGGLTRGPFGNQMMLSTKSSAPDQLKVILHELQHWIQHHEDWAVGGNPTFASALVNVVPDARRVYEKALADMKAAAREGDFEKFAGLSGYKEEALNTDSVRQGLERLYTLTRQMIRDGDLTAPSDRQFYQMNMERFLNFTVYQAMAGEIESRNVENRHRMSADDRRRIAPWRTQDVSENQGVVIRASEVNGVVEAIEALEAEGRRYSLARRPVANSMLSPEKAPGKSTSPVADKYIREMTGRYTVVQDYLAKGARFNPWMSEKALEEKLDRFTTLTQDRMFPVRRMVSDTLKYGGTISDNADPVMAEALYPRRSQHRLEKAHENLFRPAYVATQQIGATQGELKQLASLSEAAAAELASSHVHPSQALLNLYLYARHAPERNAFIEQVRQSKVIDVETGKALDEVLKSGSGMTNEEAAAIMGWFDRYSKLPKVKVAAQKVDAILEHTRRTRINGGLSPDWENVESDLVPKFKHYVPLRGQALGNMSEDMDPDDNLHANTGKAFKIKGREDPRMKGRQTYAGDMLANVVLQNQEAVVRAEKAKVGQALAAFVRKNKDLTQNFMTEVKELPKGRSVDSRTGKVRISTRMGLTEDPSFFVTKENGEDVVFQVHDPRLARALSRVQGLGDDPGSRLAASLARVTRLMSRLQTSYNPEFMVPNLMRDVQAAMIQSRQYDPKAFAEIGKKASGYALRALKMQGLKQPDPELAQKMDRLSELGGLTGVYGLTTIADQINTINKELAELETTDASNPKKMLDTSKKAIAKGFQYLENLNDAVEGATRLAVFESFREKGLSEERAAMLAKDMTVNFNRKGEWGPYMNAAYMFFNAATQGTATLFQAMTHKNVQKVALGIVLAGALQELLLRAVMPEDEYGTSDYDKIEDYILEKNLIVPNPAGGYFKIPLPLGYNVFHNAGRHLAKMASGNEKPMQAAAGIVSSVASAFNPFGSNGSLVTMLTPSVGKPVVETITNTDFTGENIHPEGMPGLQAPASQMFFPSSSNLGQGIAEGLSRITGGDGAYNPGAVEIHPDDLDHITGSYLGGLGRFLSRANNLLGFATNPEKKALEGRELRARDVPFYRSFAGNVSGTSVRGKYDNTIEPYIRLGKSYDQFMDEENLEAVEAIEERDGERLMIYDYAADMERDRIKLRREISEIQSDVGMDDAEKAALVKQLRDEEQALMNQTLMDIRQMEKDAGLR